MHWRKLVIGSIVVLGIIAAIAYLPKSTRSSISCTQCNVVVISLDPLREDAIHAFGNPRAVTPTIDELAKRGFVFSNAVAVSSWTLPSTMSLFTGVYPSAHKITNKELIGSTKSDGLIPANLQKVSPKIHTIATFMKSHGYATGAFTGGAALNPSFGFAEGFDTYYGDGDFEGLDTTVPKALDFIRAHAAQKLFVFLQGYDTHGQYTPPHGYTKQFVSPQYRGSLTGAKEEQKALREQRVLQKTLYLSSGDVDFLRAIYDEKVADADARIGQFLAEYQALGLMEKTIFVFTSSHGEEFYDHGGIDHGMTLFDELIHVPLIIVVPRHTGMRIPNQVRSIDVLPTILALINETPDSMQQFQGASLVPLMRGQSETFDVYPETDYRYATFLKGIRTVDGWKLVYDTESGVKHLYHLAYDPKEQNDVVDTEVKMSEMLFDKLSKYLRSEALP